MRESLRLGRFWGFPVALHWSVLVIVLLLAWVLADGVLPQAAPGHAAVAYWAAGVVGALLLVCSLLAHELAHAIVARRSGVEVEGLTLWVFGGVATMRGEAPDPRADFRIAAVGPATSLAVAAGFTVVWLTLAAFWQQDLLIGVVAWLVSINVVLALFNLVPGAPLDGGRILRAVLWSRSGDRYRAARAATGAGQVVAYGLMVLGLVSFVSGDSVGGLWMILIGWFLFAAARAEQEAGTAGRVLQGVTAGTVMSGDVQTASAGLSVEELVSRLVLGGRHSAYPVVGPLGEVEGLVTLEQLRRVPASRRATTTIRQVAVPLSRVATCAPSDSLATLLERVTPESGRRALVFDGGRLLGIVTPADVARTLETRTLLTDARA